MRVELVLISLQKVSVHAAVLVNPNILEDRALCAIALSVSEIVSILSYKAEEPGAAEERTSRQIHK